MTCPDCAKSKAGRCRKCAANARRPRSHQPSGFKHRWPRLSKSEVIERLRREHGR